MDRLTGLRAFATACSLLAASCSGPPRAGSGAPLAAGARIVTPATGLRITTTAARGLLGYGAAFSSDRLVTVELALDFELVVRRQAGAELIEEHRHRLGDATYDINDLAVDPDGHQVRVASTDGTVRAIDLASGAATTSWHLGDPATAVAVSADGEYVATGSAAGVICLRRRGDGALLQCVAGHRARVSALDFAGDSSRLASSSWDGGVLLWQVPSLAVVASRPPTGSANDVAFSPAGDRVAIARSGKPPRRTPTIAASEKQGTSPVDDHAVIEIWRFGDDRATQCRGHTGPVTSLVWTPDGERIVSGSWDRTVRMWRADNGRQIARLGGFDYLVAELAIDRRGDRLAAAAWTLARDGRSIVLFDLLFPLGN